MRIVFEPGDFPEMYFGEGEKSLDSCLPKALAFAYTLNVMKRPDTAEGVTPPEVTFHDIRRQMAIPVVGPVEVEFVTPPPTTKNRKDRRWQPSRS